MVLSLQRLLDYLTNQSHPARKDLLLQGADSAADAQSSMSLSE